MDQPPRSLHSNLQKTWKELTSADAEHLLKDNQEKSDVMKLWAILAVCILLLNSVSNTPLPSNWLASKKIIQLQELQKDEEDQALGMYETGPEDPTANLAPQQDVQIYSEIPDDYPDQFDDVLEFIQDTIKRLRRSSNKQTPSRRERGRHGSTAIQNSSKKTGKDKKRKNKGCVLREIHLNVTDLDLGYQTKEELIFRYCSGSCNNPETTYDQIVKNLTIKKKLVNDKVKQMWARVDGYAQILLALTQPSDLPFSRSAGFSQITGTELSLLLQEHQWLQQSRNNRNPISAWFYEHFIQGGCG
ncbi:glial cell line-derived neurotrophic factor isoform X1 [Pelobates cultripes]|uniref:Glial cell line-derived neurotrophic factor isoform X1 n=1 Tax=Pelobates cultripes TaxID=61616 RepID=A0AAD1WBH7_PELCU|nr:glial cell line-derived neurotrophic factor isoform X1 [Pelobates cultripes]